MWKNKLHSLQAARIHRLASDDITHRQCYTSSSLEEGWGYGERVKVIKMESMKILVRRGDSVKNWLCGSMPGLCTTASEPVSQ